MAEKVIDQRRKSQLFLNNVAPVTITYDEFVRAKLKPGKYLTTVTGLIKIAGMLFLLLGVSLFGAAGAQCDNTSAWYPYLLPILIGSTVLIQLTLLVIFSIGRTVKNPGFWIHLDIAVILLLSILSLICAIITDKDCIRQTSIVKLSGPASMLGSVILIVSCGSIFLMYRFNEELLGADGNQESRPSPEQFEQSRKSIFA